MKKRPDQYHSWTQLLRRPGIFYMCEGDRGVGKSYPFLLRTFRRLIRSDRAAVLLRRTENEANTWFAVNCGQAGISDKLARIATQARLDPERFKIRGGMMLYYNVGKLQTPDWRHVLRVGSTIAYKDFRDTDSPRYDTIMLDEAFSTAEQYRKYNGNEVENALDILKSLDRWETHIKFIIAGNREKAINPWLDYFGVRRPSIDAGIVSIPLQSAKAKKCGANFLHYERLLKDELDKEADKIGDALAGTAYGDFLNGYAKGHNSALLAPVPRGARLYASFDFGRRVSAWLSSDGITFSMRRVPGKVLRQTPNGDPQSILLTAEIRKRFRLLRKAWQYGRVRFDSSEAEEAAMLAISKIV